jgi:hypothetical protein
LNRNTKKKGVVTFNDIPGELIIKHMLFFLDINSLPKFSMTNKKSNECVKTHIFIRLYFLNKEKKLIEQENIGIINNVEEKRKQFYDEYEIESPTKEHACQLMNLISNNDIVELKQVFKKYNKNYENIISPLVLLLGGKVKICFQFFLLVNIFLKLFFFNLKFRLKLQLILMVLKQVLSSILLKRF